nr:auxin-responsive protein SAUR21-like [Malus domestica]
MKLWKAISLNGKSSPAPSGFLPVYIGWNRTRFLIPTHYLNFPIFAALLRKSGEEFGFKANGGIVLPCDVEFFKEVLNLLRKDEKSKEDSDSCDHHQGYLRPLLQKARA